MYTRGIHPSRLFGSVGVIASVDSISLSLSESFSVDGLSFDSGEISRLGTVNSSLTAILFRTWSKRQPK